MKPLYRFSPFGPAPLAILSVLVLANAAAQTPLPTLIVTATNQGSTVEAVLKQPISVQLRGNASTPYAWYFVGTNGTSVLTNGPSVYVADSPDLPGSPGTFEFPFLADGTNYWVRLPASGSALFLRLHRFHLGAN